MDTTSYWSFESQGNRQVITDEVHRVHVNTFPGLNTSALWNLCRGKAVRSALLNALNNPSQVLLSRLQIEGLEEEYENSHSNAEASRTNKSAKGGGRAGKEASTGRSNRFYSPPTRPVETGPGEDAGERRNGHANGDEMLKSVQELTN
jgi:hypothetical protein